MSEYRIREHRGKFFIEIGVSETKTTGALWWKQPLTTVKWEPCDINGGPIRYIYALHNYLFDPIKGLDTLEGAKKVINLWQTPDKIHYL